MGGNSRCVGHPLIPEAFSIAKKFALSFQLSHKTFIHLQTYEKGHCCQKRQWQAQTHGVELPGIVCTCTVFQFPCCLPGSKQDLISAANSILLLLSRSVKRSRNTSHSVSICLLSPEILYCQKE